MLPDIAMPGCDGYEVFRRIRTLDRDVPVAVITTMAQPTEEHKALSAGFCDYFTKPLLDVEEFRKRVYSHLRNRLNPNNNKAHVIGRS